MDASPCTKHILVLCQAMTDFAELHGFSAQERRCTDTAQTSGVSLVQIRSHLRIKFPDLSISKSTIHRLLVAPNAHRRSARLYRGIVNLRIPSKKNTATACDAADLHYTMAQVGYANELFELFHDEAVRISADDKNKINVGTLAVSRYFQIRKYFPSDDTPNYTDHDFPLPDAKIVPSGYLLCTPNAAKRSVPGHPALLACLDPRQKKVEGAPAVALCHQKDGRTMVV